MNNRKRILLLLTNYRVCEKLIGSIPLLSQKFDIDCYMVGQMSLNTRWPGNKDLRKIFIDKYASCFKKIINGMGIPVMNTPIVDLLKHIKLNEYSAIIYDDNRIQQSYFIPELYKEAKKHKILIIGNSHGNQEYRKNHIPGIGVCYDYCFVLGKKEVDFYSKFYGNKILSGGIPSNDILKSYTINRNHILCITNFLGNGKSLFTCNFDEKWAELLMYIQKITGKKIIIKQKPRLNDIDFNKNIKYISSLMSKCNNYSILSDSEDISKLISDSYIVISAFSTLAIKPIQMGIPTILIKDSGQTANFFDYNFISSLNSAEINPMINSIIKMDYKTYSKNWIKDTIEGGETFSSSEIYVKKIENLING